MALSVWFTTNTPRTSYGVITCIGRPLVKLVGNSSKVRDLMRDREDCTVNTVTRGRPRPVVRITRLRPVMDTRKVRRLGVPESDVLHDHHDVSHACQAVSMSGYAV